MEGFRDLVSRAWGQNSVRGTTSFIFTAKLKILKEEEKKWAIKEEGKNEGKLVKISRS